MERREENAGFQKSVLHGFGTSWRGLGYLIVAITSRLTSRSCSKVV
jgi:hypothetical protein